MVSPVSSLSEHLNSAQRQAVETEKPAVLVLAGAGTGKTRVLTTRIAHLLSGEYAFPNQILAVTFTNKAAREMRERVETMVGIHQAAGLWLGTFHSLCLRILRRHTEMIGLPSDFTIIDQDDQLRLIKQLLKDEQIDPKRFPPKLFAAAIGNWKDKALTPEQAEIRGGDAQLLHIYRLYQHRLTQFGVADFDDLILHCIRLFTEHSDILARYHRQFQYLLVDEYQDTNVAQYLWLRLLAQGGAHICCVGDDDQSIYGWRGAEIKNILKFEEDFEDTEIIRLEQNYRSTQDILGVASRLIAFNEGRLGKTLYSTNKVSEKVQIISVWDERMEAAVTAQLIGQLHDEQKLSLDEVAVLVRAGHQTRPFEECFISQNIPYKILGGLRFYERMEIRDAIAYIRVMANPANNLAFERIANVPKRGIGPATIARINQYGLAHNLSLTDAIRKMIENGKLKGKAAITLKTLLDQFTHWNQLLTTHHHAEVVEILLKESGYLDMWKQERTPEAQGRLDNLHELLTALSEFETLDTFLEHVSLVMDGDDEPDGEMVSIMTIHGAKGLEFDAVFLPGWEEGLFPSQKALDEYGNSALEEERRLAYVGITRAKRHLFISSASTRYVYGQSLSCVPSRFIDELPKEHITLVNAGMRQQGNIAGALERFRRKDKEFVEPSTSFKKPGKSSFRPGQPVSHASFGAGVVTKINGNKITVAFKHHGIKTLMADYISC